MARTVGLAFPQKEKSAGKPQKAEPKKKAGEEHAEDRPKTS